MDAADAFEALWGITPISEEREVKDWMRSMLEGDGLLVFAGSDEVREWALGNTDLEEPQEG